jgi:hypothetical protein
MSQNPFARFDARAHRIQIRGHVPAIQVGRLIEEYPVQPESYTSFLIDAPTPACISCYLLEDLVQVSFAVANSYIPYCAYIRPSIQLRNLTTIVLVWQREGCAARAVVRVDNDGEPE